MRGRGACIPRTPPRQILRDTVNERAVHILLECILVKYYNRNGNTPLRFLSPVVLELNLDTLLFTLQVTLLVYVLFTFDVYVCIARLVLTFSGKENLSTLNKILLYFLSPGPTSFHLKIPLVSTPVTVHEHINKLQRQLFTHIKFATGEVSRSSPAFYLC